MSKYQPLDLRKPMETPLHILYGYLKAGYRIRIYLNQNNKMIIEGTLQGFDEFMNLVLGDALEIYSNGTSLELGTTMLRGECVGAVHRVSSSDYE